MSSTPLRTEVAPHQRGFASTQTAQGVRTLLKGGHVSRLSIGYESLSDSYEERNERRVLLLTDVRLWETSVVVFLMNPEAMVTSANNLVHTSRDLDARLELEMLLLDRPVALTG
jgi:phage head maturation protease